MMMMMTTMAMTMIDDDYDGDDVFHRVYNIPHR
jgi:hypothetical protein